MCIITYSIYIIHLYIIPFCEQYLCDHKNGLISITVCMFPY